MHKRFAAVVLLSLLAAAAPARADEADDLFRRGIAAADAGKLAEAEEAFEKAAALRPSYDVLGNLALVEADQGKAVEAAEHFRATIKVFPPSLKKEKRRPFEDGLEAALKKVGRLRLVVESGAEVELDGKAVLASALADDVYVTPGAHTATAKKGELRGSGKVEVAAGASATLTVTLEGAATKPPPPAFPRWPLAGTGFALAGAALGVGIGLLVAGDGKRGDAVKLAAGEPSNACRVGASLVCAELSGAVRDADTLLSAGGWLAISGGVLAAVSIVVAVVPAGAGKGVVQVVPSPGGLQLRGQF